MFYAESSLTKIIFRFTEPTILALILVNAAVLVVQASRTLLLPSTQVPITVTGYFHAWEDFVIFALFILFTYVLYLLIRVLTNL